MVLRGGGGETGFRWASWMGTSRIWMKMDQCGYFPCRLLCKSDVHFPADCLPELSAEFLCFLSANFVALGREKPIGLQPLKPNTSIRHSGGSFTFECRHCGALHFIDERLSSSSVTTPHFSGCCGGGKTLLPVRDAPPEELRKLLTGSDRGKSLFMIC